MVVMAGCRLRGHGFDSCIGTFFFTPFLSFFSVSFFPLSFSFMLALPKKCTSSHKVSFFFHRSSINFVFVLLD